MQLTLPNCGLTHQISPRRTLRPGARFRTIRGTGPRFRDTAVGEFGAFTAVELYRRRSRLYCRAICERTGCMHDLFVAGRSYRGAAGTVERPYKIKLRDTK